MHAKPHRARLRFGAFELDPASGELLKGGVRLRLHDQPLHLLMALLERPGEIVTRKELQERLWPGDRFVEFENGINNTVSRLRDTLGDSADHPRFIETIPRRGYRFTAPVELVGPEVPAAVTAEPRAEIVAEASDGRRADDGHDSDVNTTRRSYWRPIAGLATAILVVILAVTWSRPAAMPAHSVAVLPFVAGDAIEGSSDEYLAFGMTDAIIGELSRAGALRVTSQTSTMQYKGARKPLPVIARELGVGTVVEGSVVREGGQVRITVQLIDAATDAHLWAQTYSGDSATLLSTQRALAREVAGIIRSHLTPSDRSKTPVFQQTTPAAYEAYLKGRYYMQKVEEASMARARGFFEQSIAADPNYAAAHVGLSNYFMLTDSMRPEDAMPRAEASARRALALDESSADAYSALAFVHYFGDWDWAAAERAFTRAIELDPNNAQSRRWHALYLSSMGRHATAIEEMQRAIELDPVSIAVFDSAGAVWSNAHRFDMVLEQARRILDLDPGDWRGFMHLAIGNLFRDRFDEAIDAAEKGAGLSARNPAFLCVLAVAQHRAGQVQQSQQTLLELDGLVAKGYVPDTFLAAAYLWLRSHDAAVTQLQRAYERRDGYLVVANVAPWFDALRDHPGFQELMRRMNFPQ